MPTKKRLTEPTVTKLSAERAAAKREIAKLFEDITLHQAHIKQKQARIAQLLENVAGWDEDLRRFGTAP